MKENNKLIARSILMGQEINSFCGKVNSLDVYMIKALQGDILIESQILTLVRRIREKTVLYQRSST